MGDRDALIVICWLAILILIFFECFYRKLKSRFGRDIQPPQGFAFLQTTEEFGTSDSSSTLAQLGMDCSGCGRGSGSDPGPPRYSHCGTRRANSRYSASLSPPPFHHLSKEVCHIPIEVEGGEEPPPTYEEALSFAKLAKISDYSPYGFEGWEGSKDKGGRGKAEEPGEAAIQPLSTSGGNSNHGGGNGESDLEEYTSDEDDDDESESESDMDWNNNTNNCSKLGKRGPVKIRSMRILSSSTSKVSESVSLPPLPPSATNFETVV